MVAEPQPTRIRSSCRPLMTGARPAWITALAPPSTSTSSASLFSSLSSESQVTRPSFFDPPVRCRTPPKDSICEPYSAVVTCPICSPSARTAAVSGPT